MIDELLELNGLLMSLGFGGLAGLFALIFRSLKKSREQTEARLKNLEYANVALLHDRIYGQCTTFISQGYIVIDDLENLDYLWRGYHQLGGNGTGELLYNKVKNLPIRTEEEDE